MMQSFEARYIGAGGHPVASEILNLPDLHGFLKIPGQPVRAVQVEYQAMPEVQLGFIASPCVGAMN